MHRYLLRPSCASCLLRPRCLESVRGGLGGLLPWVAVCVCLGVAPGPARAGGKSAAAVTPAVAVTPPLGVGFDANLSYCKQRDCDVCLNVLPLRGGYVVECKCAVKECDLQL